MKVWITKYAISKGIYEADADVEMDKGMCTVRLEGFWPQYFHGNDWHTDKQAAVARAEEMRIKKLQSLNKQMKKLSALKFE